MNKKFACVGIGSGPHTQYKSMVAIIFAGDFSEDNSAPEIQEPEGEIPTVPEVGEWLEGAVKMTCEVRSGVEEGKQVKKLKKY
mmetsp:Transcript_13814/g.2214  ORF Transcript_13814/g.2214 Transcript_13814/m.2214 type:complete len:83 (+) Transcript_13814:469-717(+)